MVLKLESNKAMLKAFAISDFYQLLAKSIQFPTIELAEAIIDGRYIEDGLTILRDLSNAQKDDFAIFDFPSNIAETSNDPNTLLIEMRREYSRLFNNPGSSSLPIYETTFLSDVSKDEKVLFVSPTALSVEKSYKEAGVTLVNESMEPADYLGTELEFMMFLYSEKGKAIHEQDEQLVKAISEQIRSFQTKHIKRWVSNFFGKLAELSPNTPYFTVAQFAKSGLKHTLQSN